MATWVKCTTTKGETLLVNLDNATTMAQRGLRKETTICFSNNEVSIEVKETPEDLLAHGPAGRGVRRSDLT
jgi:hypothetical protein